MHNTMSVSGHICDWLAESLFPLQALSSKPCALRTSLTWTDCMVGWLTPLKSLTLKQHQASLWFFFCFYHQSSHYRCRFFLRDVATTLYIFNNPCGFVCKLQNWNQRWSFSCSYVDKVINAISVSVSFLWLGNENLQVYSRARKSLNGPRRPPFTL